MAKIWVLTTAWNRYDQEGLYSGDACDNYQRDNMFSPDAPADY